MKYLLINIVFCLFLVSNPAVLAKGNQSERHTEFPTYFTHSNGISIAYQDFGDPNDEVVLLIMGLGGQLIHWGDDFVLSLVDKGYRVIRFDNRDIGLSEKFYNESTPGIFTFVRFKLGWSLNAPYQLTDMAADAIGLLDNLGIKKAHVAGVSMGGMIAQIMAAEYPDRVSSLTSIMSTTGASHLPQGSYEVDRRDRSKMTRDEAIQATVDALKGITGDGAGKTEAEMLATAARTYDRNHYGDGFGRQFWAILDSGDREEQIRSIKQPTVVIHGTVDPLLPFAHGEHTAELIPHADFLALDDMGHYMTSVHHQRVIDAMLKVMQEAK